MPFIKNTPESLLPRSDSKNPATTCKGITSNGRPCRRSLASSARNSPSASPSHGNQGVIAVLSGVQGQHDAAGAFFCWQHKDQAGGLAANPENHTQLFPLQERTSIDSLVDRLGVMDVQDGKKRRKKHSQGGHNKPVRRDTLPQQWQNVPGPLMTVPEDPFITKPVPPRKQRTKGDVHFSIFCCMRNTGEEALPPARIHGKPAMTQSQPISTPTRPRPSASTPKTSETTTLLSLIPSSASPTITSSLLTELSKPFSPQDSEHGYIYIFWLTPHNLSQPSNSLATSLLSPPRRQQGRRTSDVLKDYSSNQGNKTLMLKVGRANNVHRRMNEWSRQCGHHITLIRYYPYLSSSPLSTPSPSPRNSPSKPQVGRSQPSSYFPSHLTSASASNSPNFGAIGGGAATPKKVPRVARVERLIHVELSDKRVKRNCEGCGKEHREWFEVEATREGVKGVDEVIRRWVAWGERII